MAMITINGISLDPLAAVPQRPTAAGIAPSASPPLAATAFAAVAPSPRPAHGYLLIQTAAPLLPAEEQQLQALGVTMVEYVPESTYLCRALVEPDAVRGLPFVVWADNYSKDFKLPASLRQRTAALPGPVSFAALAPVDNLARDRVTVDVVLHKGIDAQTQRAEVAQAAGLDPATMPLGQRKVRITVERNRLPALADLEDVRHIEPFIAPHFANNVARDVVVGPALQAMGQFRGAGQVIAVCDTGLDKGLTDPVHPAFDGRVLALYPLGRPGSASDPNGHGTHVCGSVLGSGMTNSGTPVEGVAPDAKLVVQSVLDGSGGMGGLPTDLHELFSTPYTEHGARVHSNSWCSEVAGQYTTAAGELDDFVWTHRDCVICVAVGNSGTDSGRTGVVAFGSVGSPATAKNCIAVGASESLRPGFMLPNTEAPLTYGSGWSGQFPTEHIFSDLVADNTEGMAAFSSRGPTVDGRVRPDVVAPGTAILSTRSSMSSALGWGVPNDDPLYYYEGGTSMATPIVAGCAAVVREFLQTVEQVAAPSAALVKAMLINGATPMRGQYVPPEVTTPPCNAQGFGRVDLASALARPLAGGNLLFWDEANPLQTGQQTSVAVTIDPGGRALKATLVWTDPAGEALQNDLDLIVTLPDGREQHGNMPAGSPGFDRINNVEQVRAADVPPGDATLTVRAYRTMVPQAWALVVRII